MKQLQKNYTTPEQSKKLLELGLPIESADMAVFYTPHNPYDPFIIGNDMTIWRDLKKGYGVPCWSVGRLIEIFIMLGGFLVIYERDKNMIELLMKEITIGCTQGWLDFEQLK